MTENKSHIALLEHIAGTAPNEGAALGDILEQLDERAFGAMLFLLAMPCAIPLLYGVPQVVALPMLFLTGQILIGRSQPWLPERFSTRRMSAENLSRAAKIARKWFGWTEWFVSPRLTFLTSRYMRPLIGVFLTAFTASILVPLPLTNSVPAMAVAVVAVGLMARDGILMTLGLIVGTIWVGSLAFFGEIMVRTGVSAIKAWIGLG